MEFRLAPLVTGCSVLYVYVKAVSGFDGTVAVVDGKLGQSVGA
jgi:hypothetical protein